MRAALVAFALAAIAALALIQRGEDGCTHAVSGLLVAIRDEAPDADLNETVDDVESDCPGSGRLVDSAAVLYRYEHTEQAVRLLREAVDREPESFSAWAGLASVLAEADPAGARDAAERARELNSRFRPRS